MTSTPKFCNHGSLPRLGRCTGVPGDALGLPLPPDFQCRTSGAHSFKTLADGKIPAWKELTPNFVNPTETWKMALGLYGTFSSGWGNLDGGLAFALFLQADTKFMLSLSYSAMVAQGNGTVSATQPIAVPMRIGNLPPVIIGVVCLTVSLDGGFEVPLATVYKVELGVTAQPTYTPGTSETYPTVHAAITSTPKVSLEATYGASVTIPVLNWGWSPSGSVPLWNSSFPSATFALF